MQESWDLLLQKLGIAKTFYDAAQNQKQYNVDDEVLRKMVNYLGYPLKDIADSAALLEKIENRRWQYALEPVYVVRQNNKSFDVVLKETEAENFELTVTDFQGKSLAVDYTVCETETKKRGSVPYKKLQINITTDMAPQYYNLEICCGEKTSRGVLAVTPDRCYVPDILQHQKIWGFAVQLYSLTSRRNWGVGDFTDLKNFVHFCHSQGAEVIGLNPLNVLVHDRPENASPYSSVSRLYLNPIYIDVEKVAGFKPEYIKGKTSEIERLRQTKDIDYTGVYNLKIGVLKQIYGAFQSDTKSKNYKKYEAYCKAQGNDLENLAAYQAIHAQYYELTGGGLNSWPKEMQNPNSATVAAFKKAHQTEIAFFKFLQYLADEQLQEVYAEVAKCGLKIGLYRDLPVGLSKDSAELWSGCDLFIKDCGAGAPPDVFFPTGQKWGLGAFNPYTLKANAYRPFIKVLRAAMEGAGALRIDHVMSLMRLYIIPDREENGTYVYYNFDDMLGIVALESYLNKCMVVGESIGNVPDGFIEKLHARGIYSLSVLWAERWNGFGDFRMPYDFAAETFSSVGTHDMAPLRMRWFGYDIETMYNLKMLDEAERQDQYKGREDERRRLLNALDYSGVWPKDKPRQGDCIYGEGYPNGLTEAVETYVSTSASNVYLAQLEDIFGVEVLQNLPGTDVDKHPNWRRKLPVCLEDIATNAEFIRVRQAIKR